MRTQLKRLKSERGSISIFVALIVALVGALLVLQMSSVFQISNDRNRSRKISYLYHQSMQQLAVQIKSAYEMGRIYPTCVTPTGGLKRLRVDGKTLCIPSNERICTPNPMGQDDDEWCVSLRPQVLTWRQSWPGGGGGGGGGGHPAPPAAGVRNRIAIPGAANELYRKCSGTSDVCFHLALCPTGTPRCNRNQALALQVIRIGEL